ncbi:MAG: hypothetical protein ABFS16_11455 [Bacteroidota bacterium]
MKHLLQLLFISVFALALSVNAQDNKNSSIEADEILPQLQNLTSISEFFKLHDVAYYANIPNVPVKALEYKGDHKIAANMGVYLADMVYVMGTEGYKTADENYGAVMQLAEKAGLDDEFPDLVIERYTNQNISVDSVVNMLNTALDNSEKKLSADDKKEFYDFMLFGNYMEKLYTISSLLVKYEDSDLPEAAVADLNRSLLLMMAKQKQPLEELSKLMIGYSSNIVDHKEIRQLIKNYEKLAASKDKILKLKPADIYKAKEITTIESEVKKIRDRIVK